ncbi:MAG: Gmad2 immunoglobulin-like domain-containing protein [Bacillota bacterium]
MLVATVAVYGCFSGKAGAPHKNAEVKNTGNKQKKEAMNLAIYYVKFKENDVYLVREMHQVPYTEDGPGAALNEMIGGNPTTGGAVKTLPSTTRLLGINIRDGLATVNFSSDVLGANVGAAGEVLGIQSIVNTLTEFPQIREVSFLVEGKADGRARDWWGHVGLYGQPFKRNLEKVYEPAIWVTHPVAGQIAGVPLLVKGSARVFEGAVCARLLDAEGKKIAEGCATASRGAPGRGDFEMKLTYPPPGKGSGMLEVYWASPKDGSPLDTVKIPIQWP